MWEVVKFGKVTQRTVSFTPWLPVPLFSNNFALRPGSNHRIQRATIQKLNLQEKPYISGHRNWGKELLHVGECGEYPGRAKDGERDSLILSTKSTQSWACSGVAQCQDRPPTNTAKALRAENRHPQKARSNLPSRAKWVKSESVRCSVVSNSLQFCGL